MAPTKDLLILVADLDQENAFLGLLSRPLSLGTRPITFDIRRHPGRDAGCRSQGPTFLRAFSRQYRHALLMFDHEGAGRELQPPAILEAELDAELSRLGWGDRARAIVIAPELEVWVCSDSPHVATQLGWAPLQDMRGWLKDQKWLVEGDLKPNRPKESLRAAMHHVGQSPKAPLFRKLAEKVSFQKCQDRAFLRLLSILQSWFPAPSRPEQA